MSVLVDVDTEVGMMSASDEGGEATDEAMGGQEKEVLLSL